MNETSGMDSFSPEKLQMFAAALAGLPREEVRKAKSLYIRNALSELRAVRATHAAFSGIHGLFRFFPGMRSMASAQRGMLAAQQTLAAERIRNALEVWKDDLAGEKFDLGFLEDSR